MQELQRPADRVEISALHAATKSAETNNTATKSSATTSTATKSNAATTVLSNPEYTTPAPEAVLQRTAAVLTAHGFTVEILDDAAAARKRIAELIPAGVSVFTGASETLRLSGIDADLNEGGRYQAIRPRLLAMDRVTKSDEMRRLAAIPDYVVASVHAVTETGSLVIASGSGSQLPASAGGAAHAVWVVGAQKIVPNLPAALRRIEEHSLPLETERALRVYGYPSAISRMLILNLEPKAGRNTVLLLREAIGF